MNNSIFLWLRAEEKTAEQRAAIDPQVAGELLILGFQISVERSQQRVFDDSEYANAGCTMVDAGSWQQAPADTWIIGLKELPKSASPLHHRHVHFAHVYKEQAGWQAVLSRFKTGRGQLYDLEYLVDAKQKRIAAFGYWAGFAGAALALLAWAGNRLGDTPTLQSLSAYPDRHSLNKQVNLKLQQVAQQQLASKEYSTVATPTSLVIGAQGRSGCGALECLQAAGVQALEWDIEQTRVGGPFVEILAVDIFINCVLVTRNIPPFVTQELLDNESRRLSVICDVSCDPNSAFNPLPIYRKCTSFASPVKRLAQNPPLDLLSIDHLPSLLPRESSSDFARQLKPYLAALQYLGKPKPHSAPTPMQSEDGEVWQRALDTFEQRLQKI